MGILLPPFLLYLIIKTFQKREEQGSFKRLELIDRLVIKVKRAEQKRSYSMLIKRFLKLAPSLQSNPVRFLYHKSI
jgi:hypothetical protein